MSEYEMADGELPGMWESADFMGGATETMEIYDEMWVRADQLQRYHNRGKHGWQEIANQIIKLQEEVGEVADKYIGATGQNSRKGVYATREDIAKEMADVILTAMVGMVTVVQPSMAHNVLQEAMQIAVQRIDDPINSP